MSTSMSMCSCVQSVLLLSAVVVAVVVADHKSNSIESSSSGTTAAPSLGSGNDIIGYMVVPYPGPYAGLDRSNGDLSAAGSSNWLS